jgi:AcrR family transcriptional regulator
MIGMCPRPPASAATPRPSLRERKKVQTRQAIRSAAYRLFAAHGYDATPVDRIAEEADVSPSTVFRYFPTKEDIVLTDEYDQLMADELRGRPPGEPWMDSVRHVMRLAIEANNREDPDVARLRARLSVDVPAVRSRMFESMSTTGRLLREAIAERHGKDPDSVEVRVYAMSFIGGLMEVSMYWAEHDFEGELSDLVDRALDVLEHGLPIENT